MFFDVPHTVLYLGTLCPNTPHLRALRVGEPNAQRVWHLFNKMKQQQKHFPSHAKCAALILRKPPTTWLKCKWAKASLWNMSTHQSEPCQSLSSKCLRLGLKKVGVMTPRGCFHILEEVKMNETADDDRQCQITLECAETDGKALGIFVTVWYVALYSLLFNVVML